MTISNKQNSGIVFVLLYVLFTAIQGVWLGSFLQRVDFFATLFVNFAFAAFLFNILYLLRGGKFIALVNACGWKNIIVLNILTCVNWLTYFAAIKFIEPAVEAAIGSAVPVVTTLLLLYIQGKRNFNRHNLISVVVIFLGGSILSYASLTGYSAIGQRPLPQTVFGIVMAVLMGISIAYYTVFSKKLHQTKITAQEVMVLRFPLLLIVTAFLAPKGTIVDTVMLNWKVLLGITTIGIMMPVFCLQIGIARSTPLFVSIVVTILPLFFYVLQFFDSRLMQSLVSISGVVVVAAGVIYGLLLGKKD